MDEATRISLFARQVQASHPLVEQFSHLPKALGIARDLAALHDDIVLHQCPADAVRQVFGKTSIHHYGVAGETVFHHHRILAADRREYAAISAAEHQAQLQAAFIQHMPTLADDRFVYVSSSRRRAFMARCAIATLARH